MNAIELFRSPITFSVDSVGGSDTNDCIAAACKTIAKLQQNVFVPGDTIQLKKGSTFTEQFTPQMVSRTGFAAATFDSTYASTFSSQQTSCTGGSTFTSYQTLMLNDGEGSTAAANDATEFCRRKSVLAAETAARDAANAASTWITVTSYGSGATPILDGGGTKAAGIYLDNHFIGGWKISNVEIKNYVSAGVYVATPARGLWITNVNSHNNQNSTGTDQGLCQTFGSTRCISAGLYLAKVANTFVDNSTLDSNDSPFWIGDGSDDVVDTVSATHSQYLSPYFSAVTIVSNRLILTNSTLDQMCDGPGLSTGSSGFTTGGGSDYIFNNDTITNTAKHGSDGEAMDWEGFTANPTVFGGSWSGNADCGLLDFHTGGNNSGGMIDGVTSTNNGVAYGVNARPAFARNVATTPDKLIVTRCTINKSPQTNAFANLSVPVLSDNIVTAGWANGLAGADNTINP